MSNSKLSQFKSMDPLNPDRLLQSLPLPGPSDPHPPPIVPSQRNDAAIRKSQKADREKLRRDRLNEHFVELGKALDPDRPKNDKATILSDTIQMLKDLTSEVNKLKSEYSTLNEESRELTQEKNDLKEEKASLRSDIENLNMQYQHRARTMSPWAAMDHSVVMAGPPSYPFPMQMAMPSAPLPFHPSVSPYPYFANPNPNVIPNSCSTFVPYIPPPTTQVEQLSAQFPTPVVQQGNQSHVSSNIENKKSSGESKNRKSVDSNEVTTDLELKTPGSTVDHDVYSSERKCGMKDNDVAERSCSSSRCSSSRSVQDSSSNSVFGGANANE